MCNAEMQLVVILISFVFEGGKCRIFEEPPLCGRSIIANHRSLGSQRESIYQGFLPSVASVQRFAVVGGSEEDIFDSRISGAFVGTILGPTVVLVTCRCVARHMGPVEGSTWDPRQFGVMAGTPWDFSPVDGIQGQIEFATRIVVHPKCVLNPTEYLWDLAVMVLRSPFKFAVGTIEPAAIPMTKGQLRNYLNETLEKRIACFTAAWGWSFNSHLPKNLHLNLLPLLVCKFKSCNHSAAGYISNNVVPGDMHLCVETASSYLRLRRTGDEGSPLMAFLGVGVTEDEIKDIVLGIKSAEDDVTPDGFALYTLLDIDLPWIWNMKDNPPDPKGGASTTNLTSLQVLLILNWTKILNVFG